MYEPTNSHGTLRVSSLSCRWYDETRKSRHPTNRWTYLAIVVVDEHHFWIFLKARVPPNLIAGIKGPRLAKLTPDDGKVVSLEIFEDYF